MKARDMTVGNPYKNILLFSIPVLLGSLFQQFYNLVDTIIVGRTLGPEALAAVGSSGSIVFFVFGFSGGITQGFGVTIAQTFGARQYDRLKHLVATAIMMTLVVSLALSIPALTFCRHFLRMMSTPQDIIDSADSYLRVMFAGIIFCMSYNVAASILRAIGDSKSPLYFLIISSFLNIGLDLLFILVFKLGVAGAAYATVLAQGVAAVLCFSYIFRNYDFLKIRKQDFYFDAFAIRRMLKIGIPMAINSSVTALGMMILQSGINQFGATVVASYTASNKVEMLISQPMMALGTTMSTYCGQNMGARKNERIYKGIRNGMVIAVGIAAFGLVLYTFGSRFVISWFIDHPTEEIFEYGLQYLNTSKWFLYALALIYVFRSSLVGLNNGFIPMIGGILELICRFLCIQLLMEPFGYWSVRLTNPITWLCTAILLGTAYFHWERKHKKQILSEKVLLGEDTF